MNKGLIDLSRANKPTPPPESPPVEERKPARAAAPKVAKPANVNVASAPATIVAARNVSEPLSTIGARIPESLHQSIKVFCITHRVEMQQFVQEALAKHLAELQAIERE